MDAEVLHSGFDSLKFTVTTDIPPDLRAELTEAKAQAVRTNRDAVIERGGMSFAVRRTGGMAFSVSTGDYGAEWYFLDPENRPANNPGVTADFRAFLLATGGLEAARVHFEGCMAALGIPHVETQLRVSRADFAIDILAPWFEPDREALVAPPGTRVAEVTGPVETETQATGCRVTGLRAGHVSGRQLAIYDKRTQVIATHKLGWLEIWNDSRKLAGKPPLDLTDPEASRVWRFELRLGAKQLRHRWEMRSWADLDAMIGDAFTEFCGKVRYCIATTDSNRSRWPTHELWHAVSEVVVQDLAGMRSGVIPAVVRTVNRAEHNRVLERQMLGLAVSRAAAEGIEDEDGFARFLQGLVPSLANLSRDHPAPIEERLAKVRARLLFR